MRTVFKLVFLVSAITSLFCVVPAQQLSAEQIIAKHLDSIGPADKRALLKTMLMGGRSEFETKTPVVKGGGKAIVVSDPENLYLMMSFNSKEYPFEKVGAFGSKVSLPFVTAGSRSMLGSFLSEHSKILLDNLFGGATSLRWIHNIAANKKLKAAGMRKIDGHQAFVVDVPMNTGSDDFKVKLFFDAETFHHIRSEYHREVPVGQLAFGRQNQLANAQLDLTEVFSDFKDVEGLTLPHSYTVTFVSNSTVQIYENSWGIRSGSYLFNQKLAPGFFSFEGK